MPRQPADIPAPVCDFSFIRLDELKDSSPRGGLPAPAFPDQAERTTVANVKVHPIDGLDPSGDSLKKASVDRKVFPEPFDPEQAVVR
jgi:hypothetical protein